MTATPFDTLTAARKLRDSGMDAAQAEAIVTTFAEGLQETMATKADLDRLGLAFRTDLERVEQRLDQKIERLGDRLTIRLGGMLVVGLTVLAAFLRLV